MIAGHYFRSWRVRAACGALVFAGAGLVALAIAGMPQVAAPAAGTPEHAALVAQGKYLAQAGDCISCHTAVGGAQLAGGRPIPTPFGTIYTPNLTPERATGIGTWSQADFWKAMHEGISANGDYLYPAFPFPSFTRVTRADVNAIYAWLKTVQPVHQPRLPDTLGFPYGMRSLMAVWRMLYFSAGTYQNDPAKSAEWNRGAYLVTGLGHCAACHSPRNWLGATKGDGLLAGGMIPEQNWYAPDLGTADGNGLAGWSKQEIADFLHTGRSARGIAFGPMAEIVHTSLQHLTRQDVEAIATYLLDRPSEAKAFADGSFMPAPVRHRRAERLNRYVVQGHAIYGKYCAACHGKDGTGKLDVYPPLVGNTSILVKSPVNAIRKVLLGGFAPATATFPRPYSMPPFIETLNDHEVALVVTYIRHAWHNRPHTDVPYATVADDTVAKYRSAFTH